MPQIQRDPGARNSGAERDWLAATATVHYCKTGGAVHYRKANLDAWLESRLTNTTSEGA